MLKTINCIQRSASKRWRGSVRQVLSAIIYNLSCFTHGCSTGWVSGVLGEQALVGGAWLAALPCLIALPATPFFAVLADAKGRKTGAFAISLIYIISWLLAAWCGPRGIWIARIAAGAGGAGALLLAPIYCAEIAPRIRGFAVIPVLACSLGILFAYTAGPLIASHTLSLAMAVPPAVLLVSLFWLPETPSYLISVGRMQDAARVMCWFNGSDFREDLTEVIEQQEVRIRTNDCYGVQRRDGLKRQDSDAFQPMLKRTSGLESNCENKTDVSACRELFRHRKHRRALASCLILVTVAAGSGSSAITSFPASILKYSTRHDALTLNSTAYNLSIYNGTVPRVLFKTTEAGSVLCGTALVLGAALATFAVDKLGRKMLLICSCFGIACCLAVLGAYCDPRLQNYKWLQMWPRRTRVTNTTHQEFGTYHLENSTKPIFPWSRVGPENISDLRLEKVALVLNSTSWEKDEMESILPPIVLLSTTLFLYNVGLGSIPFVLVSELFPMTTRALASSLLISWMWLSTFILLRYFKSLTMKLGLHGVYYLGGTITLLGTIYSLVSIKTGRRRTKEELDEAYEGNLLSKFGKSKTDVAP